MAFEERQIIVGSEDDPEDGYKGEYGGDIEDAAEDDSFKIAGREIEMGKLKGGFLAAVGYLLSPVSWWNDLFINIPIAYAFGALFGLVSRDLFLPAMVIGYWITNVLGFVLMHRGIKDLLSKDGGEERTRRDLLVDLFVSIVYTVIVVILVAAGVLRLPAEYFP